MISEYALGKHKWLITSFFILWAVASILLTPVLWQSVTSLWAAIGVVLILVSGIGALMGGLFDVKHKLHGLAFGIGVPTLPIGALLVTYHLITFEGWSNYKTTLLYSSHAIWISLVLMAVSMMMLFSSFKKAGLPMGPDVEPPKSLPAGVNPWNGYANRLLVVCYIGWIILMAKTYMSI
jgi:hypothetical protein